MAKGKKKEELTIEEKLEQALVPREEWPYEVPENWCWVRFKYLAKDMADGPFGSNLKTEHYTEKQEVRIIQLSNVSEGEWRDENKKYTTFEHAQTISRSIVEPGNIVITKMMPAGRAMICPNDEKMYVLSSDNIKVVPQEIIDAKYMEYGINSHVFNRQVVENTQGITRARTSIKKIKEYSFPLPPLPEQQRIVNRIESLFSKLDEAKEKAQEALDSFDERKAAILHKAFSGELTKKWREKNGVGIDSWEEKLFDDCIEKMQNGIAKRKGDKGSFVKVLRLANISDNSIDASEMRQIQLTEKEKETYTLNINDIVMIRVNGSKENVARQILVEEKNEWAFCDHIIRIVVKSDILPAFMVLFTKTNNYRYYIDEHMVSSAGQNTISRKGMSELRIPLPTIPEQRQIIRMVDNVVEKEKDVMCRITQVTKQIDMLKKSILAKAFRGELETNDLKDESSVELLKTIL